MQTSLAVTALLMGLAGGPHCALMCGAACAGVGRIGGARDTRAMALFQLGRLAGYSALGGIAAASMQGLGWLGGASAALRPAWTMLHLAAIGLGAWLLLQARQPAWMENAGRALWQRARGVLPPRGAALLLGALWALMPCGLLQAALLVAALTGHPAEGALTMALFAVGSGLSLAAMPWLVLRLPRLTRGMAPPRFGLTRDSLSQLGMRLAGAALLASSAWVLYAGLVNGQAPWCLTP